MQYTQPSAQPQDSEQQYNRDWPNDFDLRAERAEQQEIVQAARTWYPTPPLTCSEYDF